MVYRLCRSLRKTTTLIRTGLLRGFNCLSVSEIGFPRGSHYPLWSQDEFHLRIHYTPWFRDGTSLESRLPPPWEVVLYVYTILVRKDLQVDLSPLVRPTPTNNRPLEDPMYDWLKECVFPISWDWLGSKDDPLGLVSKDGSIVPIRLKKKKGKNWSGRGEEDWTEKGFGKIYSKILYVLLTFLKFMSIWVIDLRC